MAYRPEFISAVEEEQRATIARLTAELEAARTQVNALQDRLDTANKSRAHVMQLAVKRLRRAEAAEAILAKLGAV